MRDDVAGLTDQYELVHGDCIEHLAEMEPASMDMSVFSPPFPSVYSYQSTERDIGNSEDLDGDGKFHLSAFYHQIIRVLKPGRVMCVHVQQIPRMKRSGGDGLNDFRGLNIRLAERAGFIFHGEWTVRKNPQAQSIRTKSRELSFAGLESDRARSRPALADYVLKFITPGENKVPITSDCVSRDDWIRYAEPALMDIRETDTLNTAEAKSENDTRHICALQLSLIRILVRMYTNPGEIVLSPFAGIGSEGYVALQERRRFYGIELKAEYFQAAKRNLDKVLADREQQLLLF